jgi:DNA adenine methylase
VTKPFIKWVGGKTRILDQLLPLFPEFTGTYHEPFLGGGAVFLALQPERAVLSDLNERLINAWQQVKDKPGRVINVLSHHAGKHSESHYYHVRTLLNQGHFDEWPVGEAAAFIYLNKAGFNGLYRENKRGEFNVPFGHRSTYSVDVQGILAASAAVQRADFLAESFALYDGVTARAQPGDLVYFDPPYVDTFNGYTGKGFGLKEQLMLSKVFDSLANRGVHVVLSNSDTEFIRGLYSGWRIETVEARRSVSAKASTRGTATEVVIISEEA